MSRGAYKTSRIQDLLLGEPRSTVEDQFRMSEDVFDTIMCDVVDTIMCDDVWGAVGLLSCSLQFSTCKLHGA